MTTKATTSCSLGRGMRTDTAMVEPTSEADRVTGPATNATMCHSSRTTGQMARTLRTARALITTAKVLLEPAIELEPTRKRRVRERRLKTLSMGSKGYQEKKACTGSRLVIQSTFHTSPTGTQIHQEEPEASWARWASRMASLG